MVCGSALGIYTLLRNSSLEPFRSSDIMNEDERVPVRPHRIWLALETDSGGTNPDSNLAQTAEEGVPKCGEKCARPAVGVAAHEICCACIWCVLWFRSQNLTCQVSAFVSKSQLDTYCWHVRAMAFPYFDMCMDLMYVLM